MFTASIRQNHHAGAAELQQAAAQAEAEGDTARNVALLQEAADIALEDAHAKARDALLFSGRGAGKATATAASRSVDAPTLATAVTALEAFCLKANSLAVTLFKAGDFNASKSHLEVVLQRLEDAEGLAADAVNTERESAGVRPAASGPSATGSRPGSSSAEPASAETSAHQVRQLQATTFNNLGCLERRRGNLRDAGMYLQQSATLDASPSPTTFMNLSAVLVQLGKFQNAVSFARQAISLLPKSVEEGGEGCPVGLEPVAHHNLAMALEQVDPELCMDTYDHAYALACAQLGEGSPTTEAIAKNRRRFALVGSKGKVSDDKASQAAKDAARHGSGSFRPSSNSGRKGSATRKKSQPHQATNAGSRPPSSSGRHGAQGTAPSRPSVAGLPRLGLANANPNDSASFLPPITGLAQSARGRKNSSPRGPQRGSVAAFNGAATERRQSRKSPTGRRGTNTQGFGGTPPPHSTRPPQPDFSRTSPAGGGGVSEMQEGARQARGDPTVPLRPVPPIPNPKHLIGLPGAGARGGRNGRAMSQSGSGRKDATQTGNEATQEDSTKNTPSPTSDDSRRAKKSVFGRGAVPSGELSARRKVSGRSPAPLPLREKESNDKDGSGRSDRESKMADSRSGRSDTAPAPATDKNRPPSAGQDTAARPGSSSRRLSKSTDAAGSARPSSGSARRGGSAGRRSRGGTPKVAKVEPEPEPVGASFGVPIGGLPLQGGMPPSGKERTLDAEAERRKEDIVSFVAARLGSLLKAEEEFELQYAAAVKIQSVARRRASKTVVREVRDSRARVLAAQLKREKAAARVVVNFFRGLVVRRRQTEEQEAKEKVRLYQAQRAAVTIQCVARRWLARRQVSKLRLFRDTHTTAIWKIHTWWRQMQSRRSIQDLRASKAAALAAKLRTESREDAAKRIQLWLGQKAFTQWRQKKMQETAIRCAKERASKRAWATRVVLRFMRCLVHRRKFARRQAARADVEALKVDWEIATHAAIVIQSAARMLSAKLRVKVTPRPVDKKIGFRTTAATKMQSWWRGLAVRKNGEMQRRMDGRRQTLSRSKQAHAGTIVRAFVSASLSAKVVAQYLDDLEERLAEFEALGGGAGGGPFAPMTAGRLGVAADAAPNARVRVSPSHAAPLSSRLSGMGTTSPLERVASSGVLNASSNSRAESTSGSVRTVRFADQQLSQPHSPIESGWGSDVGKVIGYYPPPEVQDDEDAPPNASLALGKVVSPGAHPSTAEMTGFADACGGPRYDPDAQQAVDDVDDDDSPPPPNAGLGRTTTIEPVAPPAAAVQHQHVDGDGAEERTDAGEAVRPAHARDPHGATSDAQLASGGEDVGGALAVPAAVAAMRNDIDAQRGQQQLHTPNVLPGTPSSSEYTTDDPEALSGEPAASANTAQMNSEENNGGEAIVGDSPSASAAMAAGADNAGEAPDREAQLDSTAQYEDNEHADSSDRVDADHHRRGGEEEPHSVSGHVAHHVHSERTRAEQELHELPAGDPDAAAADDDAGADVSPHGVHELQTAVSAAAALEGEAQDRTREAAAATAAEEARRAAEEEAARGPTDEELEILAAQRAEMERDVRLALELEHRVDMATRRARVRDGQEWLSRKRVVSRDRDTTRDDLVRYALGGAEESSSKLANEEGRSDAQFEDERGGQPFPIQALSKYKPTKREVEDGRVKAAIKIQAFVKGRTDRKLVQAKRALISEYVTEVNAAIQAAYEDQTVRPIDHVMRDVLPLTRKDNYVPTPPEAPPISSAPDVVAPRVTESRQSEAASPDVQNVEAEASTENDARPAHPPSLRKLSRQHEATKTERRESEAKARSASTALAAAETNSDVNKAKSGGDARVSSAAKRSVGEAMGRVAQRDSIDPVTEAAIESAIAAEERQRQQLQSAHTTVPDVEDDEPKIGEVAGPDGADHPRPTTPHDSVQTPRPASSSVPPSKQAATTKDAPVSTVVTRARSPAGKAAVKVSKVDSTVTTLEEMNTKHKAKIDQYYAGKNVAIVQAFCAARMSCARRERTQRPVWAAVRLTSFGKMIVARSATDRTRRAAAYDSIEDRCESEIERDIVCRDLADVVQRFLHGRVSAAARVHCAVRHIQRTARGSIARSLAAKKSAAVRAEIERVAEWDKVEAEAAVKIQSLGRRSIAKSVVAERRRSRQEELEAKAQNVAAVHIQRMARGTATRADIKRRKQAEALARAREAAAVKAQKIVRGHFGRCSAESTKRRVEADRTARHQQVLREEQQAAAAERIQCAQRQRRARQEAARRKVQKQAEWDAKQRIAEAELAAQALQKPHLARAEQHSGADVAASNDSIGAPVDDGSRRTNDSPMDRCGTASPDEFIEPSSDVEQSAVAGDRVEKKSDAPSVPSAGSGEGIAPTPKPPAMPKPDGPRPRRS